MSDKKVDFQPLELALQEIEFEKKPAMKAPPVMTDEELELAMREFEEAKDPRAKARAFKAALRLAKVKG